MSEPSRLDDWFLGVACAGSQRPDPGASLPDVHEGLTGRGRYLLLPETDLLTPPPSPPSVVHPRSLGRAMFTLVVQERHLWLCLVDIGTPTKFGSSRFLYPRLASSATQPGTAGPCWATGAD